MTNTSTGKNQEPNVIRCPECGAKAQYIPIYGGVLVGKGILECRNGHRVEAYHLTVVKIKVFTSKEELEKEITKLKPEDRVLYERAKQYCNL